LGKIIVTGASGQFGHAAASQLLDICDPAHVICLTRSPDKLADLAERGADVRAADFDDPEGLKGAMAGGEKMLLISTTMVGSRPRQHGNAIDRSVFDGQWDLLYFGYTNCPDICPLTLAELAKARQQLTAAGADAPRIVFVSVDPERDTPDVVAKYVAYFGDANLGITGDLDQIRKFAKGLGIFFAKGREEGGMYSVDHSSVVLVVDPHAKLRALFSAPHKADDFVHDLPIIMARG